MQLAASTPAMDLYYRINRDVLRMPGVYSMRLYGSNRPNELGIVATDARAAAALVGVLEPVVDGVDLRVFVGASREPWQGARARLRDRIAVIDALQGVWGHRANILPRGSGHVTFWAIDQATVDRLDPLLRDRYDMGVDPRGWRLWVNVKWKPGVPTRA